MQISIPNSMTWAIAKLQRLYPTAYAFRFIKCNKCQSSLAMNYLIPDQEHQWHNGYESCRVFCPSCLVDRGGLRPIKDNELVKA